MPPAPPQYLPPPIYRVSSDGTSVTRVVKTSVTLWFGWLGRRADCRGAVSRPQGSLTRSLREAARRPAAALDPEPLRPRAGVERAGRGPAPPAARRGGRCRSAG